MLSRKEQEKRPLSLPKEWSEKVQHLLESIYLDKIEKVGKTFEIYGLTYPDEVYIAISLVHRENELVTPVSYLMSADLVEGQNSQELIDNLIDSVGVFFDGYFITPDWDGYEATWSEAEFKNEKFHYCVSRENIGFSIIADELLEKSR